LQYHKNTRVISFYYAALKINISYDLSPECDIRASRITRKMEVKRVAMITNIHGKNDLAI